MKSKETNPRLKYKRITLKEQWNRPFYPIDTEFTKEIKKTLKELKNPIDRNAYYYIKELKAINTNLEKLEISFAEMKAEQKALNSRMNNEGERVSYLEE